MNKVEVYEALVTLIQERGAEMQVAWNELMESNRQEGKSSAGWFYIITSLGKLTSPSGDCFIISAASPIGQALLSKQVGEAFRWNLQEGKILSIF